MCTCAYLQKICFVVGSVHLSLAGDVRLANGFLDARELARAPPDCVRAVELKRPKSVPCIIEMVCGMRYNASVMKMLYIDG